MIEDEIACSDIDEWFIFVDGVEEHDLIDNFPNKKAFLSIEVVKKLCERLLELECSFEGYGIWSFGDHLGLLCLSWFLHMGWCVFVIAICYKLKGWL